MMFFTCNRDSTSQQGYIIVVSDKLHLVIPMLYKSYMAKRVTLSLMVTELIAFSNIFDAAFTARKELKNLYPCLEVPIKLVTKS